MERQTIGNLILEKFMQTMQNFIVSDYNKMIDNCTHIRLINNKFKKAYFPKSISIVEFEHNKSMKLTF
jgi:3-hydroxymyristoyl/3-hydroxydecanoyl-(acyl carrier protein) dehydratase